MQQVAQVGFASGIAKQKIVTLKTFNRLHKKYVKIIFIFVIYTITFNAYGVFV